MTPGKFLIYIIIAFITIYLGMGLYEKYKELKKWLVED